MVIRDHTIIGGMAGDSIREDNYAMARIDLYNIPSVKKGQIETAMHDFMRTVERIITSAPGQEQKETVQAREHKNTDEREHLIREYERRIAKLKEGAPPHDIVN